MRSGGLGRPKDIGASACPPTSILVPLLTPVRLGVVSLLQMQHTSQQHIQSVFSPPLVLIITDR